MIYKRLGNTELNISRICFGSLVMGPLQIGMPVEAGAQILAYALSRGINFVDTAELYETYPYIRRAAEIFGKYPIISTKSYAWDEKTAQESLDKARRDLNIDVIDIFMLHEQESEWTLKGHQQAMEYFLQAKQRGIIRAVGVSTHYIEVVKIAGNMSEIDVIHPLINKEGLGIQDGSAEQMLDAIHAAHTAGKGIYSMKALGGGNLIHRYSSCMEYVLRQPFIDAIAIGMQSVEEVDVNIDILEGREPKRETVEKLTTRNRKIHIDFWCKGCGKCVKRCSQQAIRINEKKQAAVDQNKCLCCGYCSSVCPEFAIKIN